MARSRRFAVFCRLCGLALLILFLPWCVRGQSLEDAAHELAMKVCATAHRQQVKVQWSQSPESTGYLIDSRRKVFLEQISACGMIFRESPEEPAIHVALRLTSSTVLLIADSMDAAGVLQTFMVEIPRASLLTVKETAAQAQLKRELIWQQENRIQSAIEWQDPSSQDRFLFLVSEGLLLRAHFETGTWKLADSTAMPAFRSHSRLGDGFLMYYYAGKPPRLFLDRTSCNFSPSGAISFSCAPVNVVGRELTILSACEDTPRYLGTGKGDFTQPDHITLGSFDSHPGGPVPQEIPMDSVEMSGPVLTIAMAEDHKTATAVVKNLSTGNYEVYRITSVCGN